MLGQLQVDTHRRRPKVHILGADFLEAFDLMVELNRGRLVRANCFNLLLSVPPPPWVHNCFQRGGSSGLFYTFHGLLFTISGLFSCWPLQGRPQVTPQGGSGGGFSFTFSGLLFAFSGTLFAFSGLLFTFSRLSSWWSPQGPPQASRSC